MIYTIPYLV